MMGHNKTLAAIYFWLCIITCHYLFLNMTIAVMLTNLIEENKDEFDALIDEKSGLATNTMKMKRKLGISLIPKKVFFDFKKWAGYLMT